MPFPTLHASHLQTLDGYVEYQGSVSTRHPRLHEQPPGTENQRGRARADTPIQDALAPKPRLLQQRGTHINHCSVVNLTASSLSLNTAVSCSIRVSVSLSFKSCTLASSLMRPFSKFKSSRTLACVR